MDMHIGMIKRKDISGVLAREDKPACLTFPVLTPQPRPSGPICMYSSIPIPKPSYTSQKTLPISDCVRHGFQVVNRLFFVLSRLIGETVIAFSIPFFFLLFSWYLAFRAMHF